MNDPAESEWEDGDDMTTATVGEAPTARRSGHGRGRRGRPDRQDAVPSGRPESDPDGGEPAMGLDQETERALALGLWVARHVGEWTEDDYLALPEGSRAELHDGRLILSPSPAPRHQRASGRLYLRFVELTGDPDLVLQPTDVRVMPGRRYRTPDLLVLREVTDEHPVPVELVELVAEIVSPSGGEEYTHKLDAYRDAGIEWYLILTPEDDGYAAELLRLDTSAEVPAYVTAGKAPADGVLELPEPWNAELHLSEWRRR